jgi:hypothetical protein
MSLIEHLKVERLDKILQVVFHRFTIRLKWDPWNVLVLQKGTLRVRDGF